MTIQLSEPQKDALTELINIGFGRAASALSILVGERVLIEAPYVMLYPLDKLGEVLQTLSNGEITSVHQVFSGQISGSAMLLMDTASSAALIRLMLGGEGGKDPVPADNLTEIDRETMQEIGNILLNAFTGSFGNLLQVHVSFTVPYVQYSSLRNMLASLMVDNQELELALVVRVNFELTGGQANGYVLIVMGIQSLRSLLESMRAVGYIE